MVSDVSFFRAEGEDLVFRSALVGECSVSEHLKWLHAMLQHESKRFRQLAASGASVVVCVRIHESKLRLPPEALLLMHRFQIPIELQLSK